MERTFILTTDFDDEQVLHWTNDLFEMYDYIKQKGFLEEHIIDEYKGGNHTATMYVGDFMRLERHEIPESLKDVYFPEES